MKVSQLKSVIATGATEIVRLQSRINETFRYRDASPRQYEAWKCACDEFHSRYAALAFPGGYEGAIERMLAGDALVIEAAMCFLEERPYFFRSGYMFSNILRKVKRAALSPDQAKRLAVVAERQALWRDKKSHKLAASPNHTTP